MSEDPLKPKLRKLDCFPLEQNGEVSIALEDPEKRFTEARVMSKKAFWLASLLDGTRTIEDLQAEYERNSGGKTIPQEALEKFVSDLRDNKLID